MMEPSHVRTTDNGISALIISNSPEEFRSSVLREFYLGARRDCVAISPGISRTKSRENFEAEVLECGLTVPQDHVYETLSLTELGCFYAHLKALKIATGRDGLTLIFEDDAEFHADQLEQLLSQLEDLPSDAIVKLEGAGKRGSRFGFGPKTTDSKLMLSLRPSKGSAAYIVTKDSASKLLLAASGYAYPYDTFLCDSGKHGCFMVDAVPFPIWQSVQTDSTIRRAAKKRGLSNRLQRVWHKTQRHISRYSVQIGRAVSERYLQVQFAKFNHE